MLCRRSASLMMTTRTSSAMARNILRRFSAWAARSRTASSGAFQAMLLQLGGAVDELGDLAAESPGDLGVGDAAVLLDVVDERRGDGRGVELEVGDGPGGVERMGDVGVAGLADLVAMALFGEAIRFLD